MTPTQAKVWARRLLEAADLRRAMPPISASVSPFEATDAYQVQLALLELRLDRGESLVGAKLGLTSLAKQTQMQVDHPVFGWLTDASLLSGDVLYLDDLIHPRAEPEIVFHLEEAIEGPRVRPEEVLEATRAVGAGIEVIDSRYDAFKFGFCDVVADNTSAAKVRLGSAEAHPGSLDLESEQCSFTVTPGQTIRATGADLAGGPAACVASLAAHLHQLGLRLEAGWVVLAGAPTEAVPLTAGCCAQASFEHLGQVQLTATRRPLCH